MGAEPIWPGEPFSGGGEGYLKFLTDTALPYLEERFGAPAEPENCALLGYSLGGLFALWALTKTEKFGAGASLSGSLWYPQFLKYLENCPPKRTPQYTYPSATANRSAARPSCGQWATARKWRRRF